MDLTRRTWFRTLTAWTLGTLLFSSVAAAAPDPKALDVILQKIESRHYRWVAIRAEVLLFLAASENSHAMCAGELLYQRLDERMLLPCIDSQKNLVFVFRTLDNRFDLYLPEQNTIYHGSIFDMEDSPDIESHLKPRDLYRALKPLAFDPVRTEIERNDAVRVLLNVYNEKRGKKSLARKLYLAPSGDVLGEVYYGPEGQPLTQIQRYDFREIPAEVSTYHSIIFPKKITILSPATKKGSALFFANVKALDSVDPLEFILRVPPGTKEVFLDQKNPQFALRQFQLGGKPLKEKQAEKTETSKTPPATAPAGTGPSADADVATVIPTPEDQGAKELTPTEASVADQVPEAEGPLVQYPKPSELKEDAAPAAQPALEAKKTESAKV